MNRYTFTFALESLNLPVKSNYIHLTVNSRLLCAKYKLKIFKLIQDLGQKTVIIHYYDTKNIILLEL